VTPDDLDKFRRNWELGPQADLENAFNARPGRGGTVQDGVVPSAVVNMPPPTPSRAQIEDIQRNPDKWETFESLFGPGSFARAFGIKLPAGEAQGPTWWQNFTGGGKANPNSQGEQMFRSAQPMPRTAQTGPVYNPLTRAMG
jgi:hypothetical protein